MSSTKQAFEGLVDLSFNVNGHSIPIESDHIVYMMIDSNYIENVLPIIYISMTINNTLYNNIMEYQNTGKFYLNVKSNNVFSATSLAKNILSGSFNYVPSTTNPNYAVDLRASDNQNYDDAYRTITVGLVSDVMTSTLRKSFNGVYENIDTHTLISLALEDTTAVVQIPTYSEHYDQLVIPPMTSRYKMLQFIFDKDPYYDTEFRYFMDFDTSYLLARDGELITSSNVENVVIDVRAVTDEEAMVDGVEHYNGSNYIYVNAADSNITINKSINQIADKVVAYDDQLEQAQIYNLDMSGGSVSMTPTQMSSANSQKDSDKRVYVRTKAGNLYKNSFENSGITLEIVKQNVDPGIFTPEKQYNVRYYQDDSKYNGQYILIYKRVMYKSAAGEFTTTVNLGLQKLTNIAQYGETNEIGTNLNEAVSNSAKRNSTYSTILKKTYKHR